MIEFGLEYQIYNVMAFFNIDILNTIIYHKPVPLLFSVSLNNLMILIILVLFFFLLSVLLRMRRYRNKYSNKAPGLTSGYTTSTIFDRILLEQNKDGILICNKNGNIVIWNKGAEEITGYEAHSLIGTKIWDLQYNYSIDDEKFDGYKEQLEILYVQALDTEDTPGLKKPIERKLKSIDGREISIQENNSIFKTNGEKYYCSILRDITDRKKMEEALFTSEQRFRHFIDLLPETIFECDLTGKITYLSVRGFEILNIGLDEFDKGIDALMLVPNDEKIPLIRYFKNSYSGKEIGSKSINLLLPDHTTANFLINVTPVVNGRLEGFRGVLLDMRNLESKESSRISIASKYKEIFDTAPFYILVTRVKDQLVVDVNQTLCQISGKEKKDLIGKNTFESGLFQDFDLREKLWKELMQKGEINGFQFDFFDKDNNKHLLSADVRILESPEEKYIYAICHDITKTISFYNSLEESELKYRTIFDLSPDIITVIDKEGVILDINNRTEFFTGYVAEELIGLKFYDLPFLSEVDIKILQSNFRARILGKEIMPYQISLMNKNGTVRFCNMLGTTIKDDKGNIDQVLMMATDITEQIKSQEEIRTKQKLLESVTSTTPMSIYIVDINNWEFVWNNRSMFELLGYKTKERNSFSFRDFIELLHKNDYPAVSNIIKRAIDFSKEHELELRVKTQDNNWRWIYTKITPFKVNSDGDISQLLGISLDITERKEMEESILASEKQLRYINKTKDKFFSIISHDLKAPISSFLGLSELLNSEDSLTDIEIKTFNKLINDSAKKINELLDNLLQWARIQTDGINFEPEIIYLSRLLNETIELYEIQAEKKSITLSHNVDEKVIVNADERMVSTIFRNLVSNAIKFSNEGGIVNIDIDEQDYKYLISVNDNGVGIVPEILNGLFKIDKVQSTKGTNLEEGSGLGLIIVKEFLEFHNCNVIVDSRVNKGTSIKFELPKYN